MNVPEPTKVIRDLSSLIPKVYRAVEVGVAKAKEYFDSHNKEQVDPYLGPSIMRWHTINTLRKSGEEASEDNEICLNNVPNNGIYLDNGRYHIRVLKSNNGRLPVPGHSNRRQQYYQQMQLFSSDNDGDINLIILWDVDKNYSLSVLSLACPKSGGVTQESVAAYWHCKIPDAILYGEYDIEADIKDEDIFYDLDLSEDKLDETGTDYSE